MGELLTRALSEEDAEVEAALAELLDDPGFQARREARKRAAEQAESRAYAAKLAWQRHEAALELCREHGKIDLGDGRCSTSFGYDIVLDARTNLWSVQPVASERRRLRRVHHFWQAKAELADEARRKLDRLSKPNSIGSFVWTSDLFGPAPPGDAAVAAARMAELANEYRARAEAAKVEWLNCPEAPSISGGK